MDNPLESSFLLKTEAGSHGTVSDGAVIRRHLPRALAVGVLDAAFLAGWHGRQWRLRASSRPRIRIRHPRSPVLLLPGVFENPHFLDPLIAVLRRSGRPVLRVPELLRNRATINDTAITVRRFIETAGLENLTIVAHSKGGLVGKQLMVWPETSARISSMVAIATPFRGSRYARFAPTRVLHDFSPGDATLLDLAANDQANERIVSVFSRLDPQIPDPGLLSGARNIPLATSGHFRILADRTLHRLLLEQLDADLD